MRFVFTVLFVAAGLLIMWSVAAVRVQGTPSKPKVTHCTPEQIKPGMTYDEVYLLANAEPSNIMDAEGKLSGKKSRTARWQRDASDYIVVLFEDGKVVSSYSDESD